MDRIGGCGLRPRLPVVSIKFDTFLLIVLIYSSLVGFDLNGLICFLIKPL